MQITTGSTTAAEKGATAAQCKFPNIAHEMNSAKFVPQIRLNVAVT